MGTPGSIFLDFNLPNAATWFYFSLLLAVALFLKFTRLLSVRNLDVLTLFLFVPGLLLLLDAQNHQPAPAQLPAVSSVRAVVGSVPIASATAGALLPVATVPGQVLPVTVPQTRLLWFGYLWLMCGSVYFLVRCLLDLILVQRPALSPNLNPSGLAWLAGALFVCLGAVAVRKPDSPNGQVGKPSVAVNETQRRAEDLVKQEIGPTAGASLNARFWVERSLAMLCHLAVVAGLVFIGWRHFQDAAAGMAAATFYLLLPFTAFHVEQLHHVWPTALLVWAVAAYRRAALAGVLLGVAAGTTYFPALLFPVWVSFYWRRGAGRFATAFVLSSLICLGAVGAVLWAEGELENGLRTALAIAPWKEPGPETQGFWTGVPWAWVYRMPVFIAYLAFVATTVFWPAPENLAHVLALSAAILIGIQLWYADQGGVYVLWYLPLFLLLVFRPNLTERQPPLLPSATGWLARWRRALRGGLNRLLKHPEPLVRVR